MNLSVVKTLLHKGIIIHNKKIIKLKPGDLLTITDKFDHDWIIWFRNIEEDAITASSDYSFESGVYYDNDADPRSYYRWFFRSITNIRFTNAKECELLLQFVSCDKDTVERFLKKNYG